MMQQDKIEYAFEIFYKNAGISRNPREDVRRLNDERCMIIITDGGTYLQFVRQNYARGMRSAMEVGIGKMVECAPDYNRVSNALEVFFQLYRGEELGEVA